MQQAQIQIIPKIDVTFQVMMNRETTVCVFISPIDFKASFVVCRGTLVIGACCCSCDFGVRYHLNWVVSWVCVSLNSGQTFFWPQLILTNVVDVFQTTAHNSSNSRRFSATLDRQRRKDCISCSQSRQKESHSPIFVFTTRDTHTHTHIYFM